jgi:hypothetical protein
MSSRGLLSSKDVIFIGVPPLDQLGYPQIRSFASLAVMAAGQRHCASISTTLHGSGYGLDEMEACLSLLAGFVEGYADFRPPELSRIVLVEKDSRRVERLTRDLPRALVGMSSGHYRVISRTSTVGSPLTRIHE